MEEICAAEWAKDIWGWLTSSGEKWKNNGMYFARYLSYWPITLKFLVNVLQNELEIWEIYCTLSIFSVMKACELPTLPFPPSWHSSPSGGKSESPKHTGRNMILTPGFTPQSTPYFSKGCFTLSVFPSVQFTWRRRQRWGKGQDAKKGLFQKKGGAFLTKRFVNVEQGHCWLGSEVAHTLVIHATQNHRTCSPAPDAAAATITGCSEWLQTLSSVPRMVRDQAGWVWRGERSWLRQKEVSLLGYSQGRWSGRVLWRHLELETL